MSTWRHAEVGMRVIWEGAEHEIRAIKKGGSKLRVVLAPVTEELAAKIAIAVRPLDAMELPEGAEVPDRAGEAVVSVLGATLLATQEGDELICPAMDVTLIASHLRIIHGVELQGLPISSEDELLKIHNELHKAPFHEPEYAHTHEEKAA